MRPALFTVLAVSGLCAMPAFGAEYAFSVTNRSQSAVVGITVRGGAIVDFKRIASGGTRDLVISLPDGNCATRLTIAFDDVDGFVMDYDACESGGIEVDN